VCAVVTAVLVAAVFTRSTSDDPAFTASGTGVAAAPGAIVYSVSTNGRDEIFVRNVEGDSPARRIAAFTYVYDLHLRGATSPSGEHLAVLHIDGGAGPAASLSLIDLRTSERQDVAGGFDYLSRVTWSLDAERLALVRRAEGTDPARGFALVEVAAGTRATSDLHVFTSALEVAPLAYREDGSLLVAVVDDEGSTLWTFKEGKGAVQGPRFSSGLTGDWTLSPDGDRLAFIEHLGIGDRNRGGRVLSIATGRITAPSATADQTGAVWRPGSPVPDFGGPGGTVGLTVDDGGAYLVPISWTPDGRYLVANVVSATGEGLASQSVEIVSADRRVHLGHVGEARFLGLAALE
jgi:Tol biopolymer transport system component